MISQPFRGQVGVFTGAGSGIGRALALRYVELGGVPCLVGRDRRKLVDVAERAANPVPETCVMPCDLSDDAQTRQLAHEITANLDRLDLLVHAAATWSASTIEQTSTALLDEQYAVLVRAPLTLTRLLLPKLKQSSGQIVFINSSVVFQAAESLGAYGAMKRALTGVADHLRSEVNADGVRVLSVYPGRTATPMQQRICEAEGRPYDPTLLLQPEDIASIVCHALSLPRTAEVTEIKIRPMRKS